MFSWTSWREKNETFWRWDYGKQWNICFFLILGIGSFNLELCMTRWMDTEAGRKFTSSVGCTAVYVVCCTHICKHTASTVSIYLSTYGRADEFYFLISFACFYAYMQWSDPFTIACRPPEKPLRCCCSTVGYNLTVLTYSIWTKRTEKKSGTLQLKKIFPFSLTRKKEEKNNLCINLIYSFTVISSKYT